MKAMFGKLWQGLVALSMIMAPAAVWAKVTIYMCGDSTMQDWNAGYYPKQGIGQNFGWFFDSGLATVKNHGAGGTAAETYYNGGKWKPVVNNLQKGDYVFIKFGINDRNYSSEKGYRDYMTKMINEAKAKGAYPIIVNPVRRSDFRGAKQDSIYESYHNYPIIARELSKSLKTPIIDMDTLSRNYLLSVGQFYAHHYLNVVLDKGEYSNYNNGNNDNLHFQQNGAIAFGRIITEQLRVHPDAQVRKLADYLAPMYKVDVKVSPAGSDQATTISSYYPKGMTVTLKTTPKSGKKFLGWYDGNGKKVSGNANTTVRSDKIYTFVMGSASTQFTAVYEGGSAQKYQGDGKAMTSFPIGTPKKLSDVTYSVDTTAQQPVEEEEEKYISLDIKKFIDAANPDVGNGTTDTNHTGFTGKGFFNFTNEMNSTAEYKMKFPSAGYVTMGIRYSFAGTEERSVNMYLDHDYIVKFKPTADWDTWDTAYVDLDLINGEGVLKMISMTANGGPNIDAFGFSVEGVERIIPTTETPAEEKKDSTETETPSEENQTEALAAAALNAGITLKGGILSVANPGRTQVSVFDMSGRLVAKRILDVSSAAEVQLSSLVRTAGLFHVLVRQGSKMIRTNWVNVK